MRQSLKQCIEALAHVELSFSDSAALGLKTDKDSLGKEWGEVSDILERAALGEFIQCHEASGCEDFVGHLLMCAFSFGVFVTEANLGD